jgi:hypothetical protein
MKAQKIREAVSAQLKMLIFTAIYRVKTSATLHRAQNDITGQDCVLDSGPWSLGISDIILQT